MSRPFFSPRSGGRFGIWDVFIRVDWDRRGIQRIIVLGFLGFLLGVLSMRASTLLRGLGRAWEHEVLRFLVESLNSDVDITSNLGVMEVNVPFERTGDAVRVDRHVASLIGCGGILVSLGTGQRAPIYSAGFGRCEVESALAPTLP